MKITFYILFYFEFCLGDWVLDWNDEFEGNQLDYNKWKVSDGEIDVYETTLGEVIYSYPKNTTRNIMVKNDVLAMNAFRKDKRGRAFTTATVTSTRTFLYGRIDIKAALPEGRLLKTMLVLIPKGNYYGEGGYKNGLIEILVDIQRVEFYSSLFFDQSKYKQGTHTPRFQYNDFHNYSLEWNKTHITWRLDDHAHFLVDLTQNLSALYKIPGQPFDQEFYLSLRLQVYTIRKTTFKSADNYHKSWACPSLLIDHVRYFKQVNSSTDPLENLHDTNFTRSNFCESIKKQYYQTSDEQANVNFGAIWKIVVPVCSIFIVIILVITLIWIVKRKGGREMHEIENQDDAYYDKTEYDANYTKQLESHPYLDILEDRLNTNPDYDDIIEGEIYDQVYSVPDKRNQAKYLNMEISKL